MAIKENEAIKVKVPVTGVNRAAQHVVQGLASLDGKNVGLLSNSDNAEGFFNELERFLKEQCGVAKVIQLHKDRASVPVTDAMVQTFVKYCDIVITGVVD